MGFQDEKEKWSKSKLKVKQSVYSEYELELLQEVLHRNSLLIVHKRFLGFDLMAYVSIVNDQTFCPKLEPIYYFLTQHEQVSHTSKHSDNQFDIFSWIFGQRYGL